MHLYRSYAFLMSRMMTENGGYFVCRTRHLVQAGGSKVSVASLMIFVQIFRKLIKVVYTM